MFGWLKAIGKFFKKSKTVVGKYVNLTMIQHVEEFINLIEIPLNLVVKMVDPKDQPAVATAIDKVQVILSGVRATAETANTGERLLYTLQHASEVIPPILTSLQVKSPQTKAQIDKVVNIVEVQSKVLIPMIQLCVNSAKGNAVPAPAK